LCRWLSQPVLDDLGHVKRILRAEATQRAGTVTARHLLWRYGARGPGVVAFPEYGLHSAPPEQLRALAGHVFVHGNAVLSFSQPPPEHLHISLPDGDWRPPNAPIPCDMPLPGAFTDAGTDGGGCLRCSAQDVGGDIVRPAT